MKTVRKRELGYLALCAALAGSSGFLGSCGDAGLGAIGNSGASLPDSLSAPSLTSISPAKGPTLGGAMLSISGEHFAPGATLSVGGVEAKDVTVLSGTRLTATLPQNPGKIGKVPVVVRNPDGQMAGSSELFGYYSGQSVFPYMVLPSNGRVTGMAVADWNGDGQDDVAYTSMGSAVGVILSTRDGGYSAPSEFLIGYALAPTVGDFNKDGKLDLAVVNSGKNVTVVFSAGYPVAQVVSFPVGALTIALAAGDVNADQNLDLVASDNGSDSLKVLLGNGKGEFTQAPSIAVRTQPGSVLLADWNRDGKLDLVVAGQADGKISTLIGDGRGGFGDITDVATGINNYYPLSMGAADLNGDKIPDLVYADPSSASVKVLTGDGSGAFAAARDFNTIGPPISVTAMDLDRDQDLDLVVVYQNAARQLLANDGMGNFSAPVFLPIPPTVENGYVGPSGCTYVAAGDFNGDGLPDVVFPFGDTWISGLTVVMNPQTPTLRFPTAILDKNVAGLAKGDFNRDGRLDVVSSGATGINLQLNEGGGRFSMPIKIAPYTSSPYVAVADLNADQKDDVVFVNSTGVTVLLGKGDGSFDAAMNFAGGGSGPQAVDIADFNGDKRPDLVISGNTGVTMSVLLGDGAGRFGPPLNVGNGPGGRSIVAGDFNGDGKQDVFFNAASWYMGNGAGSFTLSAPHTFAASPNMVAMADFDGDLKQEVVFAGYGAVLALVLTGDPTGELARVDTYAIPVLGGAGYLGATGDLNGDQFQDFVALSSVGFVLVHWGNGKGEFPSSSYFRSDVGVGDPRPLVADFTGDQLPDLIYAGALNRAGALILRTNIAQ